MRRVVSVGNHGCIRQQKQAIALKGRVAVHGVTQKRLSFAQYFQSSMLWSNQNQLRAEMRLHESADLFHVHTEPFWFVMLIREIVPHAKIVLDLHDAQLFRFPMQDEMQSAEERAAIESADAYVYVSERCRSLVESWVPSAATKPWLILPSYVPQQFYQLRCWGRVGWLVNEGRCDLRSAGPWYDYCKYHDLVEAVNAAGLRMYLYGGNSDVATAKEYALAEYMGHKPYVDMLKDLGSHDWGLCGNLVSYPEWQVAMPNKLFEYLAAGIPVVALNAQSVGEFVEREGVGIAVASIEELKSRWEERERCQAQVFQKRWQWTMEKHIGGLVDLYDRILQPADASGPPADGEVRHQSAAPLRGGNGATADPAILAGA